MSSARKYARPLDLANGVVESAHGTGGRATSQLIDELFAPAFDNVYLSKRNDQAVLEPINGRPVFTTDGYVVSPLFFPGGDIGRLAVNGTINDLAMAGAQPLCLSAAFVIEEGLPLADLARIVGSMSIACREAGVPIVTGDTKVVERGKGDGVFITTSGIGFVAPGVNPPSAERARVGDKVLVSGMIGDHGIAILSCREGLSFRTTTTSDTAALHGLVAAMMATGREIHVLRDPTRGGVATSLHEIGQQAHVGFVVHERSIPVRSEVNAACELLGLDPLYVANEGKLIAIVPANDADAVLETMRSHVLGRDAAIIGDVTAGSFVELETSFGGRRILDWHTGEQLPRIC